MCICEGMKNDLQGLMGHSSCSPSLQLIAICVVFVPYAAVDKECFRVRANRVLDYVDLTHVSQVQDLMVSLVTVLFLHATLSF